MRIDGDRVGAEEGRERLDRNAGSPTIGEQREEAAVGRVDVQPCVVLRAQIRDAIDRVEHAEAGRAERGHDRADAALLQARLKCGQVERPVRRRRQRLVAGADHLGDSRMGVVRLRARDDHAIGVQAACHPQRLEIGDRARGRQVREVRLVSEHARDLVDRFALEVRGRRPAVEGVVVRVDQHRHRVAGPRDGVRRLEHLPDVLRIGERVRVPEAVGERVEGLAPRRRQLAAIVRERPERQQLRGTAVQAGDLGGREVRLGHAGIVGVTPGPARPRWRLHWRAGRA